jgi:dTDP-4-amino-4,6-dideoxygalactose transaminase
MVPFLDLKTQNQKLEKELMPVFRIALQNAEFIGGSQVKEFEAEFSDFCQTKYCIGVNSGTDALRFALIAAGVGPGDEVITVPNTFIATVEAISQTDARPAFVDIDAQTYTMDPKKLEDFLLEKCHFTRSMKNPVDKSTNRVVRAVVPVHLYGQPADMDSIVALGKQFNLLVIEDACQAHGAEYFSSVENCWKKTGSIGLAAAFSFYPGKNLGACGEGGAVTTSDEQVAEKLRMLRNHGQKKKYYHEVEGYNGRLDAIQAGVLRIKLKYLPDWNNARRKNARLYNDLLVDYDGVVIPQAANYTNHVYHIYAIRVQQRDNVIRALHARGIQCGIHYPLPVHLQKAYDSLNLCQGAFPIAEKCAGEFVSLPMFPELTASQINYVASQIKVVVNR